MSGSEKLTSEYRLQKDLERAQTLGQRIIAYAKHTIERLLRGSGGYWSEKATYYEGLARQRQLTPEEEERSRFLREMQEHEMQEFMLRTRQW